jgi:hypothetical protein
MLLSLISPDNNNSTNNNRKLLDNYDIQHMDIVDDHLSSMPLAPPLPPFPPPPPPLPPNHLPFFDPLPPLPPPPPSLFNIFPTNQSFPTTNWPRPNFVQQTLQPPPVQTDLWQSSFNNTTDVDLRVQSHHSIPINNDQLAHKKTQQQRRKRSKKFTKKHHHEKESNTINHIEKPQEQSNKKTDDDEEEERLLREELLRTMSNKRKVKPIEQTKPEPTRIVTIVSSTSPPPPPPVVQTSRNPTPVLNKSQYSVNQRYKRVKASVSSTNVNNKSETTATNVRTTQTLIQTRNKIVRAVNIYHFLK